MTTQDLEQQILALIESSIEDARVPDAIAAHADKRAGKPVTKTDAEQLQAQIGVPMRISRQYKMTHIEWTLGGHKHSMLIAHKDTNVNWPTGEELRKTEHAYFGARDDRNAARKKLLAEYFHPGHHTNPSVIERAAKAIAKIREAREELTQLLDYDQPLNVVRFPVQKLAGEE